jgi:hypothetical protein
MPSPYLVCVLCVQEIDGYLEELANPSTDDGRRSWLEWWVQFYKRGIQEHKDKILKCEEELQAEGRGLSSKRGEPVVLLCRQLPTLVTMAACCRYGNYVAMVTNSQALVLRPRHRADHGNHVTMVTLCHFFVIALRVILMASRAAFYEGTAKLDYT